MALIDVLSLSCFKDQCGLPISTYFSALKIRWLMDNNEDVRRAIREKRCLFGTVDSWLLYVKFFCENLHIVTFSFHLELTIG